MSMNGNIAYVLAKKYTDDTSQGLGAVKGAPCTISSITTNADGNSEIEFMWTGNDGSTQTQILVVPKGIKGDTGNTGAKGDKGDTGAKGDKGERGLKGDKGEKGNGIHSFLVNAQNQVVITLDDGTILEPVPIADADVSISSEEGNCIFQKDDGLYVASTSEASEIAYINANHAEIQTTEQALNALFNKVYYVNPAINSFACIPNAGNREIGSSIDSISFAWATNKDVTIQTLTGCTISASDRSATYSTKLSTNKTFTLKVTDDENNSATKSLTFSFLPKVYYGASDLVESYDSAFIVELSNGDLKSGKAGTYSMSITNDKYGFIAMPVSFGFNGIPKVGGFDTELLDCGTISVTNASGYTQNYKLYRTGQKNLGSVSMVVS